MTNLLEPGMEKLLENRYEDFKISLEAGKALSNGSINEEVIDNNARQGALSIV